MAKHSATRHAGPSGPDVTPISQIPISVFAEWDKNGQIRAILAQLDLGNFQQAAILKDAVMRDDRIYGVSQTRTGALLSVPLDCKAANDTPKAQKVADVLAGSDEEPGLWDEMIPDETVAQLVEDALFIGVCVAELVWDTSDPKSWRVRLKRWHPQFVYWDWGTYCYKITTGDGVITLPNTDQQVHSDGKWFVWCPFGFQYGWLRSLIRAMAALYLGRQWNWRDWFRQNEVNGAPITKAYVPEGAKADEKDTFFRDVANRNADTAVMVPVTSEGTAAGYDVKFEEAQARTWEAFKDLMAELNTSIAIAILGQNLTTEVKEGSRAAASVQDQVRIDKLRADAKIAKALRQQVLTWWARYNFGDPELAPRPEYQVEPPKSELDEATALKMWGDALSALQLADVPIDVREMAEEHGIPMLSPEEVEAREAIEAEEAARRFDQMRQMGGGFRGPPDGAPQGKPDDAGKEEAALGLNHPTPGVVKRYTFQDLPIAVENPAGTVRNWYAPGEALPRGSTQMQNDYGFVDGHTGADGEALDCYVGPDPEARMVYVVHQASAASGYKRYDEDKIMLGFPSADAARAAYVAHRNDEDRAIMGMSAIPLERFRARLKRRTGVGKITASALELDRTHDAIMALVERSAGGQLRAGSTARLYQDRLLKKATKRAAKALAPDLVALRALIEKASSFDQLKRDVVKMYADRMSSDALAKVVERANLMAHLAGRLQAVQKL